MPASYSKDISKDLTIITIEGQLSFKELLDLIQAYKESGYSRYEIYDFRNFTGEVLTFENVKILANYIYDLNPLRPKGGKSAIIHDHTNPLGFGVSKQLIAILESENVYFELEAFYSIEDAYKWLAIPEVSASQ